MHYFINPFSFLGLLSCFLFEIPFSYLCFFLILSCAFSFNINVLGFKKHKLKTPIFGQEGGCNKTSFL